MPQMLETSRQADEHKATVAADPRRCYGRIGFTLAATAIKRDHCAALIAPGVCTRPIRL